MKFVVTTCPVCGEVQEMPEGASKCFDCYFRERKEYNKAIIKESIKNGTASPYSEYGIHCPHCGEIVLLDNTDKCSVNADLYKAGKHTYKCGACGKEYLVETIVKVVETTVKYEWGSFKKDK